MWTFQPLLAGHYATMCRWLNDGPVLQWYSHGRSRSLVEVAHEYGRAAGTRHFLAFFDGTAAGMLQTYRVERYPEYFRRTGAEPGWAGLDYLIGEGAFRGRGLAAGMVARFVDEVVFAQPWTTACLSGPDPANVASLKTLRRAGFASRGVVEIAPGEKEQLMLKTRPGSGV